MTTLIVPLAWAHLLLLFALVLGLSTAVRGIRMSVSTIMLCCCRVARPLSAVVTAFEILIVLTGADFLSRRRRYVPVACFLSHAQSLLARLTLDCILPANQE